MAAHREHRRPRPAPGRPGGCSREQPRGAARPGTGRAGRRAARPGRRRGPCRCSPTTRGSGAPCGCRAWSPSPGSRRPRRRARSTRSTGRCPASWRPSWRWRSPARPAATPTSPSRCTWSVPAPTPTTSHRPRSASPGSAPDEETSRARSARWTSFPATSRAFTQARRSRAGLLAGSGGRAAVAGGRPRQHREPHDRPRRPVPLPRRGAQRGAGPRGVARCGHQRRLAGRPAAEPALRDGLEAAYRDLAGYASSREERTHLVDQANAVRRWTLR